MDSGASIAPPECIRSAAVVMSTLAISTRSTCQRRSDLPVIASTSEHVADIPEESESDKSDESDESDESEESEENDENDESDKEADGADKESKSDENGEKEKDNNKGDDKNGNGLSAISEVSVVSASMASMVHSVVLGSGSVAVAVVSGSVTKDSVVVSGSIAKDSVVIEKSERGRSTTPKAVIIGDGDISMHSPNSPPKLHGASRISGGVFRGQAVGNSLNAADFSNLENDDYIGPVQGQINIYLCQDNPAQISPEILTAYSRISYDYALKTPIAPVLEKIARRYSPVRRK